MVIERFPNAVGPDRIPLDAATVVEKGERPVGRDALAPGTPVLVQYERSPQGDRAVTVLVLPQADAQQIQKRLAAVPASGTQPAPAAPTPAAPTPTPAAPAPTPAAPAPTPAAPAPTPAAPTPTPAVPAPTPAVPAPTLPPAPPLGPTPQPAPQATPVPAPPAPQAVPVPPAPPPTAPPAPTGAAAPGAQVGALVNESQPGRIQSVGNGAIELLPYEAKAGVAKLPLAGNVIVFRGDQALGQDALAAGTDVQLHLKRDGAQVSLVAVEVLEPQAAARVRDTFKGAGTLRPGM